MISNNPDYLVDEPFVHLGLVPCHRPTHGDATVCFALPSRSSPAPGLQAFEAGVDLGLKLYTPKNSYGNPERAL